MKKFRNGGFENGGYSHKVKLTSSQWKYPGCFLVKIPSSNGAAIPLPCSNWRVPFSTEVFVLVAWFKWRVLKGDAVGMHSSSNPFDKRPHSVFSLQEFRLDDFFFLQKLRSTCHDLELLKVTFDFPPLSGWNLRLLDPRLRPCVWMVRRASGRPRILWADVTPKTE